MPYAGNDQTDTGKPLVKMCANVRLTTISRQRLAKLSHNIVNYCCYYCCGGDGGAHWLVQMEWRTAGWSVCLPLLIFPCIIKSRSSLLALAHWINITAIFYACVIVYLSTVSNTMVRHVGLTKARCVMPAECHDGRRLTLSISRQLALLSCQSDSKCSCAGGRLQRRR